MGYHVAWDFILFFKCYKTPIANYIFKPFLNCQNLSHQLHFENLTLQFPTIPLYPIFSWVLSQLGPNFFIRESLIPPKISSIANIGEFHYFFMGSNALCYLVLSLLNLKCKEEEGGSTIEILNGIGLVRNICLWASSKEYHRHHSHPHVSIEDRCNSEI